MPFTRSWVQGLPSQVQHPCLSSWPQRFPLLASNPVDGGQITGRGRAMTPSCCSMGPWPAPGPQSGRASPAAWDSPAGARVCCSQRGCGLPSSVAAHPLGSAGTAAGPGTCPGPSARPAWSLQPCSGSLSRAVALGSCPPMRPGPRSGPDAVGMDRISPFKLGGAPGQRRLWSPSTGGRCSRSCAAVVSKLLYISLRGLVRSGLQWRQPG